VSRYGGEEFVIAFPGLSVEAAARALGRMREQLVLALSAGTVPPFTASFGVAHATDGDTRGRLAGAVGADMPCTSPVATVRSSPSRANVCPKDLRSPDTSMAFCMIFTLADDAE
jgi:hypothetical protein